MDINISFPNLSGDYKLYQGIVKTLLWISLFSFRNHNFIWKFGCMMEYYGMLILRMEIPKLLFGKVYGGTVYEIIKIKIIINNAIKKLLLIFLCINLKYIFVLNLWIKKNNLCFYISNIQNT